jgi:RNase P subunit RPR2
MAYILNKNNKLVYTGNLEEIEIDKTFDNLYNDQNGDIENKLVYKENAHLKYKVFKEMIKPTMKKIEQIIEEELKENGSLLYRPFFSLSYNTYINFENEKTDYQKYVNHIRLRILVKEKHSNITQNIEFKNIINELKKYGASTIVMNIPCEEELNFDSQCSNCQKSIKKISKNNPIYFEEELKKTFCEKCGEVFINDIKNDSFATFFNTNNYNEEVIYDMYNMNNKRDVSINPILGNICKICQKKIGNCYYLNLTNFNIEYIESPLTPIDVCEVCFNEMRKGDPFLGHPLKRLNYEKLGLNYKQMIYRKIYIPLTGE